MSNKITEITFKHCFCNALSTYQKLTFKFLQDKFS